VGLYPNVQCDTLFVELVQGDRILLCSDGCSDLVEPPDMARMMGQGSVTDATDALIESSLEAGGKDNVTCIVVEPEAVLEAEMVAVRARAMEQLFLFSDLPFHARLRVSRIVSERAAAPGERIVRQGDRGDTMYTVVQGEVAVMVAGREVATMRAGEHFGELALVDELPRSADIIAKVPTRLLGIERSALREFCMLEPALGNQVLWKLATTLGDRLRATNRLIEEG